MAATQPEHLWRKHITTWQQSGLSQASYCKQHDLIYHRFGYWYRKLNTVKRKPSGFTQVARQRRPDANVRNAGLSISLPGGIALHCIDTDNLAVVQQLLAQLS